MASLSFSQAIARVTLTAPKTVHVADAQRLDVDRRLRGIDLKFAEGLETAANVCQELILEGAPVLSLEDNLALLE